MRKYTRPSPALPYCKRWEAEQGPGNEARSCTLLHKAIYFIARTALLRVLLIFKDYRNKGNEAGAMKGYILHHNGLEELIKIKPQPGASTVCTTVNSFSNNTPSLYNL